MSEIPMTREAFLESVGAQSKNKYWSWSAVNEEKKWVIFGAWDVHTKNGREMILSEDWERNEKSNRKQPGYSEGYKNLQLVSEENYELKTYPMILEEVIDDEWTKAKIKEFIPKLQNRELIKFGKSWYAVDPEIISTLHPDEEDLHSQQNYEKTYFEGATKTVTVNAYERSSEARQKCIEHHGSSCVICDFDFSHLYGPFAKGFIHVHHIKPLHQINEEYEVDPIKDLVPVCPNCHAMIHHTNPNKEISEMRRIVKIGKRNIDSGAFNKQ